MMADVIPKYFNLTIPKPKARSKTVEKTLPDGDLIMTAKEIEHQKIK